MKPRLKIDTRNIDNRLPQNPKLTNATAIHGCANYKMQNHIRQNVSHSQSVTPPYFNNPDGAPLRSNIGSSEG